MIEKINPEMDDRMLHTWLLGSMIAYCLQYHGKLVLHGSAVLMNDKAVMFSGQSGAGKSTLASALVRKGYPLITDDLAVITRNDKGEYCILPGPAQVKLWADSMHYFKADVKQASPIALKMDKYAIAVDHASKATMIPIGGFYELHTAQDAKTATCERLQGAHSLRTLMQNAYRYFMLKPLGKLQLFFQDCSGLSQQIAVHKLTRTPHFHDLPDMIQCIEFNQGITS